MKKRCGRCKKKVPTWTDSYIEDKMKVTVTLCKLCNAILDIQREELGHEVVQEILNEDGFVDDQLLGC